MRDIKFRGKRISDSAWVYGDLLHIAGGNVIYHGPQAESQLIEDRPNLAIELYMDEVSPIIPDTVGQFTGLLDANGKEIYEGDIVKFHFMKSDPCTAKLFPTAKFFGEITTNKYNQWAIFSDGMEIHIENATEHGEVVGNIHDNPGLLKGGEE